MTNIFKYQWPAILWAIFILTICSLPMGKVSDSPLFFAGFDKLVHCGLFFVLAVTICNGLIRNYGRLYVSIGRAFMVMLLCFVFGGIIEILQQYIFTWRSGDWADLFADSVGMCMGIFSILVSLFAVDYAKN